MTSTASLWEPTVGILTTVASVLTRPITTSPDGQVSYTVPTIDVTTTTSSSPSTSFTSSLGSMNSHTSAIIGGVIGGGAALIVVIIALLLFYRYLKRRPIRRWRWRCWKALMIMMRADARRRETDVRVAHDPE
ncbi:MAG: hypothetical protein NXY57DRAFT_969207 [Lentinula lateritia]|nr:MAG: hypothetical protein NXY57DRAFT_969207 [Lentinula lateritia]